MPHRTSFNWIDDRSKAGRAMLKELGLGPRDSVCLSTCEIYHPGTNGTYVSKVSPWELIAVCRANRYRAERWGRYLPTVSI